MPTKLNGNRRAQSSSIFSAVSLKLGAVLSVISVSLASISAAQSAAPTAKVRKYIIEDTAKLNSLLTGVGVREEH